MGFNIRGRLPRDNHPRQVSWSTLEGLIVRVKDMLDTLGIMHFMPSHALGMYFAGHWDSASALVVPEAVARACTGQNRARPRSHELAVAHGLSFSGPGRTVGIALNRSMVARPTSLRPPQTSQVSRKVRCTFAFASHTVTRMRPVGRPVSSMHRGHSEGRPSGVVGGSSSSSVKLGGSRSCGTMPQA